MPKETLEEFAFPGYWDKRYLEEIKRSTNLKEATVESFEWFKTFEKLRPFFSKHLLPPPNTCHILHLGCGNSVCLPSSLLLSISSTMGQKIFALQTRNSDQK
jgi:hypothetical protein